MRNISKALPLLALLACLLSAAEARADTFYITGGSAGSPSSFTWGGSFLITGDGFTLSGGYNWGPTFFNGPLRAGQTLKVGFSNSGLDIRGGSGVIDGVTYQPLYYSFGVVEFFGSVVVPDMPDGVFTFTTPFSFIATLQGCTDLHGPINGCNPSDIVLNTSTFIGQGTATVLMSSSEDPVRGGRLYHLNNVSYDFVATPEPATLALLGTGLAGAGAAARRRRRKAAAKRLP